MEISLKEKIPVYDSLYITLTEDKGEKLITGGKKRYDVAIKYVKVEFYTWNSVIKREREIGRKRR